MTTKGTILVVDDEPIERQTLTEILRLEGYYVASVANGEAALDYVRTRNVDLMILDLRMPGMSGMDVIKVVHRTHPDIEIILLTAHGSMDTAIEALRHRIHDYLLKPASPAQILETVAKGLQRRQARLQDQLRKSMATSNDVLVFKDGVRVDLNRRRVVSGSSEMSLTPAEGRLLRVFLENPGKVFSHRELVLLVQGYSATQQEAPEILRPLVSRLRQKLNAAPSLRRRIVSVRGTGYLFETDDV
ncbi:MAG: response regulator transcription factor [Anaerolineales bacterium]|nr:response regulator transcription factor [Anaerolineales bacterium]MCX7609764.1 response regulator transcription factor [Anaerolineales bacterium]MDW8227987.1 response regulator transcription factor [Anaerolineales bacterium]